ncbi:ribonuclease H-like domain-containing protein, partial [Tanacetum coccineum]
CLTQRKYCLELIHEYGLLAAKPAATPLQENTVLNPKESDNDKSLKNCMHCPLQSHFKAALRVLRYLKGAPRTVVQFYKSSNLSLKAFSDADCKKQPTVSRSSAEAEYRCLAATTCEVIWICNVMSYLKITLLLPVEIFCDSSSAIQIASNPVFYEKTKHFEIDVHIVREKVSAGWWSKRWRVLCEKSINEKKPTVEEGVVRDLVLMGTFVFKYSDACSYDDVDCILYYIGGDADWKKKNRRQVNNHHNFRG